MKTTFPGGITAQSNDGRGDEFLAGMRCELPSPSEQILRRMHHDAIRYAETEILAARNVIAILVDKLGGKAFIDDCSIYGFSEGGRLLTWRDESRQGTVFATRGVRPFKIKAGSVEIDEP